MVALMSALTSIALTGKTICTVQFRRKPKFFKVKVVASNGAKTLQAAEKQREDFDVTSCATVLRVDGEGGGGVG